MPNLKDRIIFNKIEAKMPQKLDLSQQKQFQDQNQQNEYNSQIYNYKRIHVSGFEKINTNSLANKSQYLNTIHQNVKIQKQKYQKRIHPSFKKNISINQRCPKSQNIQKIYEQQQQKNLAYESSNISQSIFQQKPTKKIKLDNNQISTLLVQKQLSINTKIKKESQKIKGNFHKIASGTLWMKIQKIKYTIGIQICKQFDKGAWVLQSQGVQFIANYINEQHYNYRNYNSILSYHYHQLSKYQSISQIIKANRLKFNLDQLFWRQMVSNIGLKYKLFLHHKRNNYSEDQNTMHIQLNYQEVNSYIKSKLQKFRKEYMYRKYINWAFVDRKLKMIPFLKFNIRLQNPIHLNIKSVLNNLISIQIDNNNLKQVGNHQLDLPLKKYIQLSNDKKLTKQKMNKIQIYQRNSKTIKHKNNISLQQNNKQIIQQINEQINYVYNKNQSNKRNKQIKQENKQQKQEEKQENKIQLQIKQDYEQENKIQLQMKQQISNNQFYQKQNNNNQSYQKQYNRKVLHLRQNNNNIFHQQQINKSKNQQFYNKYIQILKKDAQQQKQIQINIIIYLLFLKKNKQYKYYLVNQLTWNQISKFIYGNNYQSHKVQQLQSYLLKQLKLYKYPSAIIKQVKNKYKLSQNQFQSLYQQKTKSLYHTLFNQSIPKSTINQHQIISQSELQYNQKYHSIYTQSWIKSKNKQYGKFLINQINKQIHGKILKNYNQQFYQNGIKYFIFDEFKLKGNILYCFTQKKYKQPYKQQSQQTIN